MRAFGVGGSVVLHGEQVGQGEPNLAAEQLGERLGRIANLALVLQKIFFIDGLQFWIAANFELLVIEANRREIFGKPFVEPSFDRRIVVIKKKMSEIVGDGAPRFVLK